MATQKQIEANRRNAQASTGPVTPEGKAASSRNALKSGLDAESQFVLGETREEFAEFQEEWYNYIAPRNPEERYQLDNLIRNEWFLRRYFRIESQLWEYHSMLAQRATGVELGEGFSKASPVFMRLQRRIAAAEKARSEARQALDRLRAHPDPDPAPQPRETTAETPKLASFRTAPAEPPSPPRSPAQPRPVPARDRQKSSLHPVSCLPPPAAAEPS